jgi:tetratricopeptide (TPR) repeat protein
MPKNPETVNPLARILANAQLKVLYLLDIVDRRGPSPSRNNRIALLYLRLKQRSEALDYAEQALPGYPETYFTVAQRMFDMDTIPNLEGQNREAGINAAKVLSLSLDNVVRRYPSLEKVADLRFKVCTVLFANTKRPRTK